MAVEGEHCQVFVATAYGRGGKYHYCWNILISAPHCWLQGREGQETLCMVRLGFPTVRTWIDVEPDVSPNHYVMLSLLSAHG